MFHLFQILLDRALGYLERYYKSSEKSHAKHRLLTSVSSRLARLCMIGKLNGFTDYELSVLILPKLKYELGKRIDGARWWTSQNKLLSAIFLFTFLFFALFMICLPCQRFSRMLGRKLLFQLEPYWDWQNVYYSRCLLPNDYLGPVEKSAQHPMPFNTGSCDYCEDVIQVPRLRLASFNYDQEKLDREFVFQVVNKMPFVYSGKTLTDEIEAWPLYGFVSIYHWIEFFNDQDENRQATRICMFKSSLVSVSHPSQLFNELNSFRPDAWFTHWENCGIRTMKQVRKLFTRPSILPPMIELSKPSWILLSGRIAAARAGEQGRAYKQINALQGTDLLIVIQIHGQVQLKLTPTRSDCSDRGICSTLHSIQLTAGQMAVVSANYWTLSYRSMTAATSSANEDATSSNYTDGFNLSLVLAGIHV